MEEGGLRETDTMASCIKTQFVCWNWKKGRKGGAMMGKGRSRIKGDCRKGKIRSIWSLKCQTPLGHRFKNSLAQKDEVTAR